MHEMYGGRRSTSSGTRETSLWKAKVRDLRQVHATRMALLLYPTQNHDEDEAVEEFIKELLFLDLECRQENGNHKPNLCVVQDEAGKEWIFQSDKTIDKFCKWLFTMGHAGCTVMAYNFQGYDSYFVLQYLRKQGVKYNVIMCGAKVLSLKVELSDIRFIDLLNFLPMKLVSLPKTFVIEELAKGYFPHFFNKKENENYVGPILPVT